MEGVNRRFRPEFVNRIDEIIVFHALSRDQIRSIVELQLERVRRTARGQGIGLEIDPSVVEYLADVGYRPEFGARELKRRIRAEVESRLATAMLQGDVAENSTARLVYDAEQGRVRVETLAPLTETEPQGDATEAAAEEQVEEDSEPSA